MIIIYLLSLYRYNVSHHSLNIIIRYYDYSPFMSLSLWAVLRAELGGRSFEAPARFFRQRFSRRHFSYREGRRLDSDNAEQNFFPGKKKKNDFPQLHIHSIPQATFSTGRDDFKKVKTRISFIELLTSKSFITKKNQPKPK